MNNIIQDTPIYWINLERSPQRREYMENLLEGFNHTRIDAIDGQQMSDDEYENLNKLATILSKNDACCALSHLKAIQQAYDEGLEYVIIAEDDISFDYTKYLTKPLKDLILECKTLVQCVFIMHKISKKQILFEQYKIGNFIARRNNYCAACYIIHRDYMQEVLNRDFISVADDIKHEFIFSKKTFMTTIPYFGFSQEHGYNSDRVKYIPDIHKIGLKGWHKMLENYYNDNRMKFIIQDIPIYWINLERRDDRRIHMENLLTGFYNTRIEAIDGNTINLLDWDDKINTKKKLSKYEIACALSHIKAIQQAYDDGCEYAIIAEDDITFEYADYLTKSIKEMIQETKTLVQLIFFIREIHRKRNRANKYKNGLFYNNFNYWCASFYVIHRDYMEEVIEKAKTVLYAADDCESDFIFSNKTFCTLIPYVGLSSLQNNSNINNARTMANNNKFMANWHDVNK